MKHVLFGVLSASEVKSRECHQDVEGGLLYQRVDCADNKDECYSKTMAEVSYLSSNTAVRECA